MYGAHGFCQMRYIALFKTYDHMSKESQIHMLRSPKMYLRLRKSTVNE